MKLVIITSEIFEICKLVKVKEKKVFIYCLIITIIQMNDLYKFERTMNIEYSSQSGNLKMNLEGGANNFYSFLNELEVSPNIVNIGSLKINRIGVHIELSAPVLCETDGEKFETKMLGVKFEGVKPDSLLKKIPGITKGLFGEKWERAVERQRKRIEERRKF